MARGRVNPLRKLTNATAAIGVRVHPDLKWRLWQIAHLETSGILGPCVVDALTNYAQSKMRMIEAAEREGKFGTTPEEIAALKAECLA